MTLSLSSSLILRSTRPTPSTMPFRYLTSKLFHISFRHTPNDISHTKTKRTLQQLTKNNKLSSLAPMLTPHDQPVLTKFQAIGLVAAAQANFMRVVVEVAPPNADTGVQQRTPDGINVGSTPSIGSGVHVINERTPEDPNNGSINVLDERTLKGHNVGSMQVHVGSKTSMGTGVELLCVVKAVLKKIKRRVLVGDKVLVGAVDWVDGRGMIENVFERVNEVTDPPVANVDHLLVLFSLEQPRVEEFSLTRFLIEAESTGIPVTLAFNKCELVDEQTRDMWKSKLHSWGYEPIFCSVDTKHGLDALECLLREQTTVLMGPSGVGKSSLINALRSKSHFLSANDENWLARTEGGKWSEYQRVGEVSVRSGRGKHTTRHVSLLPLSSGGYLADTPGFNQPSLLKVTKRGLAEMFPEMRKMLNDGEPKKCSFKDCLHLGEPGCLVNADWERYPYYLQLLDEIKTREEFQLRTFGTKQESDMRFKIGNFGVKKAEPRLDPKKHRRISRKRSKQSFLNDFDDDEYSTDVEEL